MLQSACVACPHRNNFTEIRHQRAVEGHWRLRAQAAGTGGTSAATPPAGTTSHHQPTLADREADVASLSTEELQVCLSQRQLSPDGSRLELEARLAGFLSTPGAYPEADCQPARRGMWLVGGRLFGSTDTLRRHIQLLLQLLQGEEVQAGHPDYPFLCSLLQLHPRYAEKVSQPPVVSFRVRSEKADDHRPILFFEYMDGRGEWDDFSYRKCIGFSPAHNASLTVRDAMRLAVRDQLDAFRIASTATTANGRPLHRCDACGRRVQSGHKLRLEHVEPTFHQLIKDFVASADRQPPPVDGHDPATNRGCFTDQEWVAAWRKYHRTHVRRMQLVCIPCAKTRSAGAAGGAAAAADAAAGQARRAGSGGWAGA